MALYAAKRTPMPSLDIVSEGNPAVSTIGEASPRQGALDDNSL
jgi:hypothetical protein